MYSRLCDPSRQAHGGGATPHGDEEFVQVRPPRPVDALTSEEQLKALVWASIPSCGTHVMTNEKQKFHSSAMLDWLRPGWHNRWTQFRTELAIFYSRNSFPASPFQRLLLLSKLCDRRVPDSQTSIQCSRLVGLHENLTSWDLEASSVKGVNPSPLSDGKGGVQLSESYQHLLREVVIENGGQFPVCACASPKGAPAAVEGFLLQDEVIRNEASVVFTTESARKSCLDAGKEAVHVMELTAQNQLTFCSGMEVHAVTELGRRAVSEAEQAVHSQQNAATPAQEALGDGG